MKTGQGFLLVFSITSMTSLHELAELREQIIRIKDDMRVPIVLVGNKSDLEEDRAVSRARAFAVSQSWGGCPYYETSARRRANVDEVFTDLCRQIIMKDMADAHARGYDRRQGRKGRQERGGRDQGGSYDGRNYDGRNSTGRRPPRQGKRPGKEHSRCVIL
jgi:hypothetical protein